METRRPFATHGDNNSNSKQLMCNNQCTSRHQGPGVTKSEHDGSRCHGDSVFQTLEEMVQSLPYRDGQKYLSAGTQICGPLLIYKKTTVGQTAEKKYVRVKKQATSKQQRSVALTTTSATVTADAAGPNLQYPSRFVVESLLHENTTID